MIITSISCSFQVFFRKGSKQHLNVTKIKSIESCHDALYKISKILKQSIDKYVWKIDNLTAITNLNRTIDLHNLLLKNKDCEIHYNNLQFPGLFIRKDTVSGIIFKSGKIVIIGAKTEEEIQLTLDWLKTKL